MKTLYVSDLDGTLLNKDRKISDYTKNVLQQAIKEGLNFTVATARTPATVVPLLEGIDLKLPIIVTNGCYIYDLATQKFLHQSSLPKKSVERVLKVIEGHGKSVMIYTLVEHQLTVYYKTFNSQDEVAFYEERKNLTLKKFQQIDAYPEEVYCYAGQMAMLDMYDVIKPIYDEVSQIEGLKVLMYRDVNTESGYLLEIACDDINKAQGIEHLKAYYGFDEIVAFGDNLNDLEMIEAADCGCAVGNAEPALKAVSDLVIDANTEDGVAKFLLKELKRQSA